MSLFKLFLLSFVAVKSDTESSRDDYVDTIYSFEVDDGTYGIDSFCPAGSFISAMTLQILAWDATVTILDHPGLYDDMATLNIRAICKNFETGEEEWISTAEDVTNAGIALQFCTANFSISCPENHWVTGFKSKIQTTKDSTYTDDATGLNMIKLLCTGVDNVTSTQRIQKVFWPLETEYGYNKWINVKESTDMKVCATEPSANDDYDFANMGFWGDDYSTCGYKKSACGFSQKSKPFQYDDGDDIFVSGLKIHCCYNPYSFTNSTGYWKLLQGFGGSNTSFSLSVTLGITKHEEQDLDSTFTNELQQSITHDIKIPGYDNNQGTGTDVTQQIANDLSSSLEISTTKTYTVNCAGSALYQWVVDTDEYSLKQGPMRFSTLSTILWCISDSTKIPQCYYRYCKEDETNDCQTCEYPQNQEQKIDL